jgi:CDP-diacylglycerol--glycerol-3-phosphate 3-phosphatidyltransferase
MNIPNLITVLRVLLIPIFILLFYLPYHWSYMAASSVFALAAATDWLDGYLARRLEQSTPFGAFLDPVADKLMVAVALVLLVQEHANFWLTLPAAVIIGREIVISALREWMAELGARAQVAVSNLGKWKTAAQMLALIILLANPPAFTFWVVLGYVLLMVAAGLTLWSMVQYLRAAWPHLRKTTEKKIKLFLNQGVDGVI